MLLERGADVNAQGGEYGNALQAASSRGHQEIVQMLLERGADIDAQGGKYSNALQAASSRGHQEIVQMLLERGADVNAQGGEKVGSVTEKGLVIAPQDYWATALKSAVKEMLQMKKKTGQRVRPEGTAVTVKASDRSQQNLELFCAATIDWKSVEKQLRKWSNLVRMGKILTIDIVFHYRGDDVVPQKIEKRGRVSVTSRMLVERKR
ncbi:uncharacterized protein N7484_008033 [Penicillium longicatenatum]|uniref:uncharacterized protein n=1 Tax=Penicillium longicatenatum TaxID=1561947 RepID=UPI0025471383|nr:uncharacterized protein N7484_008033 [Penicillium longicatenatum]KAJ5640171.1 hypothetical protein N7484_008033 [Penicillium longicatenatum]